MRRKAVVPYKVQHLNGGSQRKNRKLFGVTDLQSEFPNLGPLESGEELLIMSPEVW
jgi:hypothetical protein